MLLLSNAMILLSMQSLSEKVILIEINKDSASISYFLKFLYLACYVYLMS